MHERFARPAFLLAVAWFLLGFVSACTEGAEQGGQTVAERDSAGVAIVETSGVIARAPIDWKVSEEPDLQLGSVTSGGPDQFFLLNRNVIGLPDGRIVVLGAGDGELRIFSSDGRFLRRFGGLGDGPGEFRVPILVPYTANDSVLVFDTRQRRMTLFAVDGQGFREFIPQVEVSDLVVGRPWGASEDGILSSGTPLVDSGLPGVGSVGVRWADLDTKELVVFAQFDLNPVYEDLDQPVVSQRRFTVPFHVSPSAALGPDGLFVTWGNSPEIRNFDSEGRLVRIWRVEEPARPVTQQDIEVARAIYLERNPGRSSADVSRAYDRMEFPDRWPSFQEVRVDPLGWTWVEVFRIESAPKSWILFDPDGVAHGTLDLPDDLDVTYVGADYVLGVWRDELGVEYVRRYRIERTN